MPIELPRDIFVALDHEEGAMRVLNNDIVLWHTSVLFSSHEGKMPTVTEADEGGQEGQQYGGE